MRISVAIDNGRIEDVLQLATKTPVPMAGSLNLRAVLELPPGNEEFVDKLRLDGSFDIRNSSPNYAEMVCELNLADVARDSAALAPAQRLTISKHYLFGPAPQGCEVSCEISLQLSAPLARPLLFGIESVINLLAPTEPDRFFETPDGPKNLRFAGQLPAPLLRVEDGWQRLRITLNAPQASEFWIAPIETVSESEGGFERVYQGSQILALWRPNLTGQTSFSARLLWRIESI